MSGNKTVIYVELVDEAVDVWRLVEATYEGAGIFRLTGEQPRDETWAFAPGSLVRCERRTLEGHEQLVAVDAA